MLRRTGGLVMKRDNFNYITRRSIWEYILQGYGLEPDLHFEYCNEKI